MGFFFPNFWKELICHKIVVKKSSMIESFQYCRVISVSSMWSRKEKREESFHSLLSTETTHNRFLAGPESEAYIYIYIIYMIMMFTVSETRKKYLDKGLTSNLRFTAFFIRENNMNIWSHAGLFFSLSFFIIVFLNDFDKLIHDPAC